MREEKRLAELVTTKSGTVAQLWCIVKGLLHWCHCISLSQRAEKSQDRETPLQVFCYFLMSVSVIWEQGIERKAVGRKRHKKGYFNNLSINYKYMFTGAVKCQESKLPNGRKCHKSIATYPIQLVCYVSLLKS